MMAIKKHDRIDEKGRIYPFLPNVFDRKAGS
jgi:hypothetical protein